MKFFASLLALVCAVVAFAQPIPPKATAGPAVASLDDVVIDEGPLVYYPARDPLAYMGQACYDQMELTCFGVQTNQTVWNLDLSSPPTGNYASGLTRSNLPFNVQFSVFIVRDVDDPSLDRMGTWYGVISGDNGSFHCGGYYFELGGFASIVPLYARSEQAEMFSIHENLLSLSDGGGYDGRQWNCALDETALFQAQQNYINATACADAHFNRYMCIAVVCTAIGVGSCWISFGAGCIGALICDGVILIKDIFWQREFMGEQNRARSCLCLESNWRTAHPGQPIPNSSCGDFHCPDSPGVDIPKLD